MNKGRQAEIYQSGVQVQWAAVRTILEEIKLPPQNHRILLGPPKPTAAMNGNSFGSAILPPIPNKWHSKSFAYSAHSKEKEILTRFWRM
jgi:hypothetical protein